MELLETQVKPKSEATSDKDHSQETEIPDDVIWTPNPGTGKLFLERAS